MQKQEMLELARMMERNPEGLSGGKEIGVVPGSYKWNMCVEALKIAARTEEMK